MHRCDEVKGRRGARGFRSLKARTQTRTRGAETVPRPAQPPPPQPRLSPRPTLPWGRAHTTWCQACPSFEHKRVVVLILAPRKL